MKTYTESEVRQLRDNCYGKPISDHEWEKAGPNWMNDIEWLLEHQPKSNSPPSTNVRNR